LNPITNRHLYKLFKMKSQIIFILAVISLSACTTKKDPEPTTSTSQLTGTWKLISGTLTEKGNSTVTDYTKNISFIKIINDTHFAFLQHDLNKGKGADSVFIAGGGSYSLKDSAYTEHLEYCTARNWEDNNFSFTVTIQNDTLVQRGVEKVEAAGIDRVNIEKYVRIKK
jgi:hypothetical protein